MAEHEPVDLDDVDGVDDEPAPVSGPAFVNDSIIECFQAHADQLRAARRRRKEQLRPKSILEAAVPPQGDTGATNAPGGHGPPNPAPGAAPGAVVPRFDADGALDASSVWNRFDTDAFDGDAVLRCLYSLLDMIDDRGYQRSTHQLAFHQAFIRATSRVIYKSEWAASKPNIMRANEWDKCPSEILVSTPRRFGKTFRYRAGPTLKSCNRLTRSVCLAASQSSALVSRCPLTSRSSFSVPRGALLGNCLRGYVRFPQTSRVCTPLCMSNCCPIVWTDR
jgi:hypothetical protein